MFGSKDLLFSSEKYGVAKSLRFRNSASAYLSRTPASAGNQQKWTWSAWVKPSLLNASTVGLIEAASNSSNRAVIYFNVTQTIGVFFNSGGTTICNLVSNAVFRDPSSWYHFLVSVDTTQATDTNRVRIYVNGNQITSFSTATYPTLNFNTQFNSAVSHVIGAGTAYSPSAFYDGYLAEVNFIDGQALTPSSFGFYDNNGIWQPAGYTGTYGTNGFYLKFTDVGATSGANSGYGKDFSGFNTNYWTTNNFGTTSTATTYDSMYDSPVNASNGITGIGNYCVLNPLDTVSVTSLTEANLYASLAASASANVRSSLAVTSGKWYWEVTFGSTGDTLMVGVCDATVSNANSLWSTSNSWMYYSNNGNKYGAISGAYGATFTNGDIIGVALDLDNGTLVFYKNNVSQGTAASSGLIGRTLTPTIQSAARALTAYGNFGQRPFTYTPPSGYSALNTQNLTTPTISNGAAYMAATTYTGTSSSNPISNATNNTIGATFQPDFVWIKNRNYASGTNHVLIDSVRGASLGLASNLTNADFSTTGNFSSINNNGFTVTGTARDYNFLNDTFVGWQWNAGGSTVAGTGTGGITNVSYRANPTAGFSVVIYTGSGALGTVTHGLGATPSMIIVKQRTASTTTDWGVYHSSLSGGANNQLLLNTTAAAPGSSTFWGNAPTSSVFSVWTSSTTNASSGTYVAYCFAPVAGYSAFGSYTGNGSTDGPFVYTGFRPRWILRKRTDTTSFWIIFDTSRNTYNVVGEDLYPNDPNAGNNDFTMDILSNGFKVRGTGANINASGGTYIYACFAENPFKISRAR